MGVGLGLKASNRAIAGHELTLGNESISQEIHTFRFLEWEWVLTSNLRTAPLPDTSWPSE